MQESKPPELTPEQIEAREKWVARKRHSTIPAEGGFPEGHSAEIIPFGAHKQGGEIFGGEPEDLKLSHPGNSPSLREIGLREITERFSPSQNTVLDQSSEHLTILTPSVGKSNESDEHPSWFSSAGSVVGSYFGVLGHNEARKDEKLMETFGMTLVSFEDKLNTVEGIMGKFSSNVDFTLLTVKLTEWRADFTVFLKELEKIELAKVPGDPLLKEEREWIHESAKQVAVALHDLDTFTNELQVTLKIKSNLLT